MKQKTLVDMLLYILGMSFNLALMVLVGYAVYQFTLWGFAMGGTMSEYMVAEGEDYEVPFVLEEYTSLADVARKLEEEGIIHRAWMFRLERMLMNRGQDFRPGEFTLNRNMTSSQINNTLRARAPEERQFQRITIPEGWTIADMANYFERRGFFDAEDFIYAAQHGQFNYGFLMHVPRERPNRLEGYLFPDTYEISMTPSPEHIIHRMLMRFEQLFSTYYQDRAYDMGLTIDEIVIMASIIERETVLARERPLVSQVIHNRLRINMPLQMCSTVSYTIGPRDRLRLTYEELQTDSPWNTYLFTGLPIGPISNPGWASIHAAMFPEPGNYLFFVVRDWVTGEQFFSTNQADHDAAAARYLD
ncbi:MAG: endolytic transglycosylase MltG [Defluviitaleaceae bacterium]|nr:endolytic transglycosylase MltG [Defluviitaleaceae bacterium]MCL2238568.1 endolytic transglycosylase MltG [Defluviitaleaceae bacterium]